MRRKPSYLMAVSLLALVSVVFLAFYCSSTELATEMRMGSTLLTPIHSLLIRPLLFFGVGALLTSLVMSLVKRTLPEVVALPFRMVGFALPILYLVLLLWMAGQNAAQFPYLVSLILQPQWFLIPGVLLGLGIPVGRSTP